MEIIPIWKSSIEKYNRVFLACQEINLGLIAIYSLKVYLQVLKL